MKEVRGTEQSCGQRKEDAEFEGAVSPNLTRADYGAAQQTVRVLDRSRYQRVNGPRLVYTPFSAIVYLV